MCMLRNLVYSLASLLALGAALPAIAQSGATVNVHVTNAADPVLDATVVISGVTYMTDRQGSVSALVPAGALEITVVKEGFVSATTSIVISEGQAQQVEVDLQPSPTVEETIPVSATRTDARLEDQPMRVEVLARAEIEG